MDFTLATIIPEHGWSLNILIVMLVCNLIGLAICRIGIQRPGEGPQFLPIPLSLLGKFGWPDLIAGASVGHIIGVITILALRYTDFLG